MVYCYQYPRPAVTVDIIIETSDKKILLIKREKPPFQGHWALPGGFLDLDESLLDAAKRELVEETGLVNIDLFQFRTYGNLERDPKQRTVSVVFIGKCGNSDENRLYANDDAAEAQWFSYDDIPSLAFDHQLILNDYFARDKFSI